MGELAEGVEFFFDQVDTRLVPRECAGFVLREDRIQEVELLAMKHGATTGAAAVLKQFSRAAFDTTIPAASCGDCGMRDMRQGCLGTDVQEFSPHQPAILDESVIELAAITALKLFTDRTAERHGTDMACLMESFKIMDLERQRTVDQIMALKNEDHRKNLGDMLTMVVSELKQIFMNADPSDAQKCWELAERRILASHPSVEARGEMVSEAERVAQSIQSSAMFRVAMDRTRSSNAARGGTITSSAGDLKMKGVLDDRCKRMKSCNGTDDQGQCSVVRVPTFEKMPLVPKTPKVERTVEIDDVVGNTAVRMAVPNPDPSSDSTESSDGDESSMDWSDDGDQGNAEATGGGANDGAPGLVRNNVKMTLRRNLSINEPVYDTSGGHSGPSAAVVVDWGAPDDYEHSPFDLGVAHAVPPEHMWENFYADALQWERSDINDMLSFWVVHRTPWELKIDGEMLRMQLRPGGEMGCMVVECARRMLLEKEIDMMHNLGDPIWRWVAPPNVSVQFIVQPGEYDMVSILKMFKTENVGFLLVACLMLMVPLTVDCVWSMYALDMKAKQLNVLDPTFTEHTEDEYEDKHGDNARHVLNGIAAVGRELEDGWAINPDEWKISYNIGMHEPCSSEDSGPCIIHYARFFDAYGLDELVEEDTLDTLRRLLMYELVAMKGNQGDRPGFMLLEEED